MEQVSMMTGQQRKERKRRPCNIMFMFPLEYTKWSKRHILLALVLFATTCLYSHGFSLLTQQHKQQPTICKNVREPFFAETMGRSSSFYSPLFMSTFASDASEYSSKDTDYDDDDDDMMNYNYMNEDDEENGRGTGMEHNVETIELQPPPMSKNTGNRFIALYWDHELEQSVVKTKSKQRSPWILHYDRDELNEDHVMFCRKCNLYNETFNTDSMVDVLRSLPILASDLQRIVGHCFILETNDIKHIHELLKKDPIIRSLTDNGKHTDKVPLYRWRHIRDHTLRIDDGRFGYPCMIVALDDDPEAIGGALRTETEKDNYEYLIRSQRVIMGGPLYLPTQYKDDPSSIPVGDLIMFNAKDRDHAIEFAENMPSAQAGLYKDLRVHFYNNLDVTGKFVSEDPFRDTPGEDMKEAMEFWGYPVGDDQTPWLNY